MKTYEVGLTKTITEHHYIIVEAESEEEASNLAKEFLEANKDLEPDSSYVTEIWPHEAYEMKRLI